jgi:hypothetical protein
MKVEAKVYIEMKGRREELSIEEAGNLCRKLMNELGIRYHYPSVPYVPIHPYYPDIREPYCQPIVTEETTGTPTYPGYVGVTK